MTRDEMDFRMNVKAVSGVQLLQDHGASAALHMIEGDLINLQIDITH